MNAESNFSVHARPASEVHGLNPVSREVEHARDRKNPRRKRRKKPPANADQTDATDREDEQDDDDSDDGRKHSVDVLA
jgi:hypothetical protein